MKHTRRTILSSGLAIASGISTEAMSSPSIIVKRRRVTDNELWSACAEHVRWRNDPTTGRRMSFADRDLSGLRFPDPSSSGLPNPEGLNFLCLNGSDFTNADLSFCQGGNIAFARCHFQTAILSNSDFASPAFATATFWHSVCRHVRWGHSNDESSDQRAVMTYLHATKSDFTGATIRGYFHQTTFNTATMREADLSYCTFAGSHQCDSNNFWAADLSCSRFCYSSIDNARFTKANLDQTDFHGARLGIPTKAGLYKSHPDLQFLIQEAPST